MNEDAPSSSSQMPALTAGVVRFNVGGTLIEMARETLESYPKSLLRNLAIKCPEHAEVFIDRDPAGLQQIIEYLHSGPRVIYNECTTLSNADFLEKEAEFYGFDDLALKCSALYEFKQKSEVTWRPEVIEDYYPLFAKCIVDPSLLIPWTFERNAHIVARCIACETSYEPKNPHVFVFSLQEWAALKHHMSQMIGVVEKLAGHSCVIVRWSNNVVTHLPKSAVRVLVDDI
ncbi:BTB domain-containing protein [Aphelenchoides fujianensis]|nr:BTB domain-containing protein [Aphelenchoides fujianensis]